MRVLIATSEPSIADVVSTLLKREGLDLEIATADHLDAVTDGADLVIVAVNSLQAGDCSPAERVGRVLGRMAELHSPVVALAGWPDDARERSLAAGARASFPLPFNVAEFLGVVRGLLPQSPMQPAGS